MDKEKKEKVASIVYKYIDEQAVPYAKVDIISEGSNSICISVIVPDGCKDDIDEGEVLDLIAGDNTLNDVDVSVVCYEEGELEGSFEETEDPDAGAGDEDPDDEDEIKADRLTVHNSPDEDDYDNGIYSDDYGDEEEDDDDDDEDIDPELLGDYQEEEYTPTKYDWEDVKGFYGDDDDGDY